MTERKRIEHGQEVLRWGYLRNGRAIIWEDRAVGREVTMIPDGALVEWCGDVLPDGDDGSRTYRGFLPHYTRTPLVFREHDVDWQDDEERHGD